MGLDMYLSVRKYVSQTDWENIKAYKETGYDSIPNNPQYDLLAKEFGLEGMIDSNGHGGGHVSMTAIYWRKANAIHGWFVRNCAEGVDDCKPVYISRDHLEELYDAVCEVLAHRGDTTIAEEILPIETGFFFGAATYGDWYWEDLEYTRDTVRNLLDKSAGKRVDFEYVASW